MPITLPPISRRRFLTGTLASAASSLLLPRDLPAAGEKLTEPHRFVVCSDTHIHADRAYTHATRIKPWDTFAAVAAQITALPHRPAAVIVNGDCAALTGVPEDYATLIQAVEPLRKSGLTLHLVLGNHDHRENFIKALASSNAKPTPDAPAGRHITLLESEHANLYLLDSLDLTNQTPGVLGERQLAWLARSLDARPHKPAILFVHHDPDDPVKRGERKISGLVDTPAFLDLVLARKQVKAYVYGHTHRWQYGQYKGLHLINLPPTAWLFDQAKPRGWVDLTLTAAGATFQLKSLDPEHPHHDQKVELKW